MKKKLILIATTAVGIFLLVTISAYVTISWLNNQATQSVAVAQKSTETVTNTTSEQKPVTEPLNSSKIEALVNEERAKHNLPALADNPLLDKIACARADDMIARNYYSHVNPDGNKVQDLAPSYGYNTRYMGENIALGSYTNSSVVADWINSPEHEQNIVFNDYTEQGVCFKPGHPQQRFGDIFVNVFGHQ
jgi:uncharacterized protein YkwD